MTQDISAQIKASNTALLEELLKEVEGRERPPNDLKAGSRPCDGVEDHRPLWDGQFYTCEKCGQEFILAKHLNKLLSDIASLIKEKLKN
jgi:hypothetical protein